MADEAPTVRIADLRQAISVVLDQAERTLGMQFHLGADFYWDLPLRERFDPTWQPSNHTLAALADDVAEIESLLAPHPDDEVILWHDLHHIAGVLLRMAALDLPDVRG